ncbi:hypothetical protein [Roseivirga sp.]|uniref:hypothetical protein n=1 Tax=Roseivirga sp. TaxID=1964215 RepID=UPI003B8AB4C6
MKRLAIVLFFTASFLEVNAQLSTDVVEQMLERSIPKGSQKLYGHPSQLWHEGEIVLNDGKAINGKIKYDLAADAVHFDLDGAIRTFVANQIKQFVFFQESIKGKRYFVTIPFAERGNYKRPKLFEIFYSNGTSLLAREEEILSNWTIKDPQSVDGLSRIRRAGRNYGYDYFLAGQDGELRKVGNGVKGVVRSFHGHHKKLRTFIKSKKLNVKETWGMVSLVEYYNTLD